jgi:hypothetical protein
MRLTLLSLWKREKENHCIQLFEILKKIHASSIVNVPTAIYHLQQMYPSMLRFDLQHMSVKWSKSQDQEKLQSVSQIPAPENVPFNHSAMLRIGSSGPMPNPGPRSNFGTLAFFFHPLTGSFSECGLRRTEGAL